MDSSRLSKVVRGRHAENGDRPISMTTEQALFLRFLGVFGKLRLPNRHFAAREGNEVTLASEDKALRGASAKDRERVQRGDMLVSPGCLK